MTHFHYPKSATAAGAQPVNLTQVASTAVLTDYGVPTATAQRVVANISVAGAAVASGNPVPVALTAAQIATLTPLTTVAVTQGTSPWVSSQSGTWNITNISGTVSLPTGASTETTLAALNGKFATQTDANLGTPTASTQRVAAMIGIGAVAASSGAGAVDAGTQRVVANIQRAGNELSYGTGAADSNTLRFVSATGSNRVGGSSIFQALVYAASGLTTSYTAALPFIDATTTLPTNINAITVFSSTGTTLRLTWGGGSPTSTNTLLIPPGGIDFLAVAIPISSDIRLASNSGTSTGDVVINFLA